MLADLTDYLSAADQSSDVITLKLHDHVTILGAGRFEGLKDFKIYANQFYGSKKFTRERFDYVEVVIPKHGK